MRLKNRMMDMTVGSPWRVILLFSVPIILGNILQEFYSLVDSLIVSRSINLDALAAIGGTSSVRSMLTRICTDCSMAFGIAAANRVGAQKWDEFKTVIAVGTKFGIGLSVILVALIMPNIGLILKFMKIAGNIYADARLYFMFAIAQLPLTIGYNLACAFLRAAGDSRTPFVAIFFSSLFNIVFDILLVAVLKLGVLGAAVTTMLAQFLSFMIVFRAMFRKEPFRTEGRHWARNRAIVTETTKLWIPMFANSICIAVGMMIVSRPINASGSLITAGIQVGNQIYTVLEAAEKAIANGIGVYVGQNMGARRYDRVRLGMRHMTVTCFILATMLYLAVKFNSDWMIMCFINKDQTADEIAVSFNAAEMFLRVLGWGVYLMFPMHFFRAAIQAMGHTVYPMIGAFAQAIARWLTATYAPAVFGLVGLCLPDNTAALACLPLVVIPYFYYIRKCQQEASREMSAPKPELKQEV